MSHAQPRRTAPRLAAAKNRSRIEFGTAAGLHRVAARVLDVNREGALIVAEELPPRGAKTWVRMEDPARTDRIAALAVRLGHSGRDELRFLDPCPDDFLLAALVGVDFGPMLLGGAEPLTVDDVGP